MKKILFALCTAAVTMVACNKAEVAAPIANDDARVVKFETQNLYSFDTKAAMAAESRVSIFAGAPINVSNANYTVSSMPGVGTSGELTGSAIQWGLEQMGTSTTSPFFAIYPYYSPREFTDNRLNWPITTAANVEEAKDVLVAYAEAAPGVGEAKMENPDKVSLSFTHPFALLEYTITNNSDDGISRVEVSGVNQDGYLYFNSGLTTLQNADETFKEKGTQVMAKGDGNVYYAVIYPAHSISPVVTIHLFSGASVTYTPASATDISAGTKYTASIAYNNTHTPTTSNRTTGYSFSATTAWTDAEGESNIKTPDAGPVSGDPGTGWPVIKGENFTINDVACDWNTGIVMKCVASNLYRAEIKLTANAQFKIYNGSWFGAANPGSYTPTGSSNTWTTYHSAAGENIHYDGSAGTVVTVFFNPYDETGKVFVLAGSHDLID